ncbi:MAG: division/cell wall cluster transcriptional repressor MraZ [Clostridiales bacterium]|jgi:MraZ protein|nr:division/cell wall cluster transcriptional repressor MraZ [Clostridiales bacterium]
MFLGRTQHSIDTKGRWIVPSKLRADLGGLFYVTFGFDGCLYVYPRAEWEKMAEKTQAIPTSDKEGRKFLRSFFGEAMEAAPDGQWRILISERLREYAKIDKEVYLIGVGSKLELWSKEVYDSAADLEVVGDDILSKMADLGI